MPTLEEQETIITQNRADDYVSIWTSSTPDIAYFRKTKGFELVKEDTYQGGRGFGRVPGCQGSGEHPQDP